MVEHRKIVLAADEKLVAQLTSRRKLYDSKEWEKLESKAGMRARGLESPNRADALIGAVMLAAPFGSGAIGAREFSGICFDRPGGGRALFSAQQVSS